MTETTQTHVSGARLIEMRVTPQTAWLFVEVAMDNGISGWGEASLPGSEQAVHQAALNWPLRLTGDALPDPEGLIDRLDFRDLPSAALSSAVLQAVWDISARQSGISLADRLGGRVRDEIGLYANVNRRTDDRSPEGFARSALDAVDAGFDAIKIAPFDEVVPGLSSDEARTAMSAGLHRIAAVHEALGAEARLMVDCHWRFDHRSAPYLIDAVRDHAPYWVECPVPENEDMIDLLVALRRQANSGSMRLAGLETSIRAEGFMPYLRAGAYDVMMPDVKYAGGPDEMLRLAGLLSRHGVAFSPHNPTGPICHMQSIHVCAAARTTDLLEHQFRETPLFDRIAGNASPPLAGRMAVPDWSRPGLGISLKEDELPTTITQMQF